MRVSVADVASEVERDLRAQGRPERAEGEKRYLKSALVHYGVPLPQIRKVAKAVRKAHPELSRAQVRNLARALWEPEVHERRMAAVEVLTLYKSVLDARDLRLCEALLREAKTWALVDPLAIGVVGDIAARAPEAGAVLDAWAKDEDFWIRRSALLALLLPLRAGGGDFARFTRYADLMLDEREFFIRKAMGWVLREAGKRDGARVLDFLLPRAARLSGVTLREALKPLTAAQRKAVLAARAR